MEYKNTISTLYRYYTYNGVNYGYISSLYGLEYVHTFYNIDDSIMFNYHSGWHVDSVVDRLFVKFFRKLKLDKVKYYK